MILSHSFFGKIYDVDINIPTLLKKQERIICSIFNKIFRKIKIIVDNRKKVYYTNNQLIEYVPHKISEVEVAIFISKVIESVGLDDIT